MWRWITFFTALVIGLLSALPILNDPKHESFWAVLGSVASFGQSIAQRVFDPTMKEVCYDSTWFGRMCSLKPDPLADLFSSEAILDFFVGPLIELAGAATAGVITILVALQFMGKEKADAKRREIFSWGQPSK